MNLLKNLARGLATVCAVVAGGVSAATFDTSVECDAARLAHRWSFNGSKEDSAGGRTATFVGWAAWNDVDHPTAAKTFGSTNGRGYVDLGYDLFSRTGEAATIEIWAQSDGLWNSSRVFDIGVDTSNYLILTWSNGLNATQDALEWKLGGSNTNGVVAIPAVGPLTIGTKFHISVVLQQRADGKIDLKLTKRDVATGAVLATYSATTAKSWSLGSLANWRCYLGHSNYASDGDAEATYDEVRIWHTALTDAQLAWSALMGPDQLPTAAVETVAKTRALATSGNGQLRVNDGAVCAATNVTAAANEILTVTAVPGEGQTFLGWEGATDDILTGMKTDATITLRTAGTGALKAVFLGANEPVRSVWTGAGDGTSPGDAANWASVNAAGASVVAVPTAATTVVLQGSPCGFSCPAGTAFAYASLVVSNATLAADADWRGLGAYAVEGVVDLAGHKLYTGPFSGSGTFTSPVPVDTTVAAPAIVSSDANFWLDAADSSTLALNADGTVKTWTSKDAKHVVATSAAKAPTDGRVKWGFPTLDFGVTGSGQDMRYTRFTNLRTVFWVMRIEKNSSAFLLGDWVNGKGGYNFHRGTYCEYGVGPFAKYDDIWNGLTSVDWEKDVPANDELLVLSSTMTQNCCSDSLTQDRNMAGRNGGRQLSELICFPSVLADADRTAIVQYLQQKWKAGFATAPAELHVCVPADETLTNSGVQISGHIKLVKEGAGTFVAARAEQNYWDGTQVAAGTLKPGIAGSSLPLGTLNAPFTVESGATFDVAGYTGFSVYPLTLAGGTLTNSGTTLLSGSSQIGSTTLTADSFVAIGSGLGISNSSLDLGGHTLTVASGLDGAYFMFENTTRSTPLPTMTNGTIRFTGDYALKAWNSFDAHTVDFDIGGSVYTHWTTTVHNLTFRTPFNYDLGNVNSSLYRVTGTYTPVSRYTMPIELADGATLDLSGTTLPFSTKSDLTYSNLGSRGTSFAAGATVTVDVHGQTLTPGQCVIAWQTSPTDVTFQWDETTRTADGVLAPTVGTNGLYYGAADTTVAVAHWTGAAGDGDWTNAANWTCSNAFDAVVADGIPGAGTHVHLAGDAIACTVPSNTRCGSFEIGPGSLAGTCDLSGLTCTPTFVGTVDLKGHNLYVNNDLAGTTGTITDSTGFETLEYIESTGEQRIDTGICADEFTGVEADFMPTTYKENTVLFGSTAYAGYRYLLTEQSNAFRFYGAGAILAGVTPTTRYRLVTTPSGTLGTAGTITLFDGVAGTQLATQSAILSNIDAKVSLKLFDITGGGKGGLFRLYGFKMTKNGETLRDFVPVRLVGTGMAGLYDRVSKSFFTNVGTQSRPFRAGPTTEPDAAPAGELHLVVPAGSTTYHQYVGLTGFMKLVIEGAGTYVASARNQTYWGGTEILNGTAQLLYSGQALSHAGSNRQFGAKETRVIIDPGATLDMNGNYDSASLTAYLNGGRFVNNAVDQTNTTWGCGHVTELGADSTLDLGCTTTFWGENMAHKCNFYLNGHTLTINLATNKYLQLRYNSFFTNGVMRAVGAGRILIWNGENDSRTADFDLNGVGLQVDSVLNVRDYIVRAASPNGQWGANALNVYGRFAPYSNKFYSPTLQDGATLDLSMKSGAWSVYTDEYSVPAKTTFASGASIKVELGARTPAVGEKLVAWDELPEDVTFAWTDSCAANLAEAPAVKSDGLYYGGDAGEVIVAHWTGAAGDGDLANAGNWVCSNAYNRVVANGVPGAQATVYLEGAVNCQFPKDGVPNYAAIEIGDCTLTADCDWRGLDVPITGTIDLAGHKLYVSRLDGSGTVTSTIVPQAVAEPAKLADAALWLDASRTDTMRMDANNNVSNWCSRAGSLVASRNGSNGIPVYSPSAYGRPTLDFGALGSTRDLIYTRQTFRTVFWVIKIVKDTNAFLLGDVGAKNYNYHRGENGAYCHSISKFTKVWNGMEEVNRTVEAVPDTDFQIISGTLSGGNSNSLTNDRNLKPRNGGRQLSELIGFTTTLEEEDRVAIVQYLQAKWGQYGELHIDVPAGETVTNPGVSLIWNVKLVKDGEGTFVPQRASQSHLGGTEVTAGTLRVDRSGTTYNLGPSATNVQIDRGATFDVAGYNGYTVAKFVLNGGEITNSGMDLDDTTAFGTLALTDDSSFRLPHNVSTWWDGHAWDLGGHTLTVSNAPAAKLQLGGGTTTYTNGTLRIEDGWLRIWYSAISAKTLNLYQNGRFDLAFPLDIGDYTAAYAGGEGANAAQLNVWGRFTPMTDYFYGCTLQDGSTLDLGCRSETWSVIRTGDDEQPKLVDFANDATVTVDLHGVLPGGCRQIVDWTDNTPTNLVGLTFTLDSASRRAGYRINWNEKGIFIESGLILILR